MRSRLRLICPFAQYLITLLVWILPLLSYQAQAVTHTVNYMEAGYDYGDTPASYTNQPKHQVLAFTHTSGTTALDHYTTTDGSQTDQGVYAMHQTDGGVIFIGGRFSKFNGTAVNSPKLTKLNSSTFKEQGTFLTSAPNNDVTALASYRLPNSTTEYLIVGGRFTSIGGQTRGRLALINLATNQIMAWDANLPSTVHSIAVDKERAILHVGGDFGYYQYSLANLATNPSTITPSQSHTNGRVFSIYLDRNSQQVFIGGTFNNFLNSGKQYLAILDANTQSVLPNTPNTNGVVYSITSRLGNRAYILGDFTTMGGYSRAGLAAIDLPSLFVNYLWNPGHTWSNKSSDPGQSTADGDGDGLSGTRYGLVAAHILYSDNYDVIIARSGMQSYAGFTISTVAQNMELGSIDPETGEHGGWLPHIPTNYTPTINAYHSLLSANGYLYVSATNDLLVRYAMTDPVPKLYLGDSIDMESGHNTSADASGDSADDDGIIGDIPPLKVGDSSYSVVVKVTNNQNKTAYLRGWLDLNKNNVFDSTEANNANLTIPANSSILVTLTWNNASLFPITAASVGQTFLRLRVSSIDPTTNESATWNLIDGEVEDYPVSITPVIAPVVYTPPPYGKCQSKSVEQIDKFQYATATGAGATGIADLRYTPPDGTNRMMMVFISIERDHSPLDTRGDNFEINIPSSQTLTNADMPNVSVNGQAMNKMSFSVEAYGNGNNYSNAEISRSYYFYTLFDPYIPDVASTINITGLNLPKSAGDEMMVGAVTFGNVLAAQPVDSQIDRTAPFQIDLNVSPVIANAADQAFGTTTADNALIAFGNSSKAENLTIGTGWTKLAEVPVINIAGGYKNDANRLYSANTEDDGHTFYLQSIKNVTTPQTASVSSNASLSGLGLQAFRLVPLLCDHGDAPESYGDAYHSYSGLRFLGSIKADQEPANTQNIDADGDDKTNGDDEDGVTIPTLIPNQANNFTVKVNGKNLDGSAPAYLNAWIDLDGNGKFESTEQIAQDLQDTDGDGQTIVPVTVNDNTPSRTYARFRISASSGALNRGYADYGEVEDYVVNVAKTEIKGRAWYDKNSNGLQDDGDTSYIAGAKVELFDPAINDLIAITTTDAQGNYSFIEQNYSKPSSLPFKSATKASPIAASKAYQIRINTLGTTEPFADWQITNANAGTDDTLDSDATVSNNYWVINTNSPLVGQVSNYNDFGFKNTIAEGCLDIGSTGISDDTLVNAHSNSYDFNFAGKQLTGFCLERNDASPQLNDSYEINTTDRQGLSAVSRVKLARLFNALTDPEISFTIASVSDNGREQARLDDLLGAMVWYYTFYYENISNIDSLLDGNTNLIPGERQALKSLARKIANRVDGSNGEYQYAEQPIYWLWNKTITTRQDIIVPAIYAKGASCSGTKTLSGTVFEDVNYAGGVGRSVTATGAKGVAGAKVELYNAAGAYVSNTSTASDGTYSFSGLASANYYVRVVNNTVKSTRTGSNGTERGVQTYRSASTTEVTNKIGGENPAVVDADANTTNLTLNTTSFTFTAGAQAQSVQFVALNSNINNANFGFNFDTIVNTNDSGQGSLRQFILNSNLLKNNEITQTGLTNGVETSIFMIPGTGPFSIKPNTALPTISDNNTALDGTTQPNTSCADSSRALMIMLDGSTAGSSTAGLSVDVANTKIQGLAIGNFTNAGLSATANATNLTVTCNNLGLAADGSTAAKNGTHGLSVIGAQDLTVGGTNTDARNIISNNQQNGIYLEKVTRATIMNNRIGTSADGLSARPNNQEGAEYAGIRVKGTSNAARASTITIHSNQIAGNNKTILPTVTSGGSHGIYVDYTNTLTITGNLIGLTADGLTALNNLGNGIYTQNTTAITIGGNTSDKRNIIAGNSGDGIKTASGTNDISILGNYIGLDITGLKAIANESNGIFLSDTVSAKIGDGTEAGRNIIANNKMNGIRNSQTPNTSIKGNYIGTDKNSSSAFGNNQHGIYVQNSAGVVIGGSSSNDGNIIANNTLMGVFAVDAATNALLENNIIGLTADGVTVATNKGSGVETKDTNGLIIRNNTISSSGASGIHLVSSPNSGIINNRIGTDITGTLDKGNKGTGVDVQTAAVNLTLKGNVISGNDSHGIQFTGGDATGTQLYDNRIGTTQNGSVALANNGAGIMVNKTPNLTIGSTSNTGNTIAGNGQSGINLFNDQTNLLSKNITIVGNNIGISQDATTAIANTAHGVLIQHVSDVKIGDGTVSGSNRIAYNNQAGLQITGTSNNVTVNRNAIYANNQLGIDLNMDVISLNDANDVDTGPNAILNAPIISSMILNGANMTLTGCAPAGSVVEVYEADVSTGGAATSGANRFGKSKDYGEGQSFLTSFTEGSSTDTDSSDCVLPVDADGNNQTGMKAFKVTVSQPATIADKDLVTATATVANVGTSEFGTTTSVGPITCSLVVKTTSDVDNTANNSGSLRDAIECANAQAGADTITFNIPKTESGYDSSKGIWKLQLSSALPAITDSKTTIDASTQTGAACGNLLAASHGRSLKVQLDGTGLSSTKAALTVQASNFTLKGLSITNFAHNAVDTTSTANNTTFLCDHIGVAPDGLTAGNNGIGLNLFGTNNTIGGLNDGDNNIIAGNTTAGVVFNNITANAGLVQGNYIGIGIDGNTAIGNNIGISNLTSTGLTVGGATAVTRNIISGNKSGISLLGPKISDNFIKGNYIGTDKNSLTAVANEVGITLDANSSGISIGGIAAGEGNVISGNSVAGISSGVDHSLGTNFNTITSNIIGLGADKTTAIPNDEGIVLYKTDTTSITKNIIARNNKNGINLGNDVTNSTISQNAIYANGELGIDLRANNGTSVTQAGITLNDANDTDTGANQLLNFPVISDLIYAGNNITVTGCARRNGRVI